ncbi:MAG: PepSY-like domain-containing protein [Alistipes sp.]|jgi:hypothetical protein|nr:PepSY-like domain-containing protein [Alistipes sp.]
MKKLLVTLCALSVSLPLLAGDDRPIAMEQLPVPAREFVKAHFDGVKVALSTVDRELTDTTYEVFFADGRKVEFDGKGRWKEIDCKHDRVPAAAVPEAIAAHIEANYPGRHVTEISRDRRDYEVQLDGGLELTYDTKFRLIEIDN